MATESERLARLQEVMLKLRKKEDLDDMTLDFSDGLETVREIAQQDLLFDGTLLFAFFVGALGIMLEKSLISFDSGDAKLAIDSVNKVMDGIVDSVKTIPSSPQVVEPIRASEKLGKDFATVSFMGGNEAQVDLPQFKNHARRIQGGLSPFAKDVFAGDSLGRRCRATIFALENELRRPS